MDFAICWLSLLSVHTKVLHNTHTLWRRKTENEAGQEYYMYISGSVDFRDMGGQQFPGSTLLPYFYFLTTPQ